MHHPPLQLTVTGLLVLPFPASMGILEAGEAVGTPVPPEVTDTSEVRPEWPILTVYTVL